MAKLKLYEGEITFTQNSCFVKEVSKGCEYTLNTYSSRYGNWKEIKSFNFIFYHEFEFKHFSRGRSSVTAVYESLNKTLQVEMFIKGIEEVILNGYTPNILKGYFCFKKQGQNYAVQYLGVELPESNLQVRDINRFLKGEE